jgi:hypothetical protein
MFKKRTIKGKKPQVRRRPDDQDQDEIEDDIQQAIQKAQKKQKLLSSLPVSLLSDYAKRKIPTTTIPQTQVEAASSNDNNEGSLLAQKHQQAMDEFITQKLQGTSKVETTSVDLPLPKVNDETALYQELAEQAGAVTTLNQKEQEGDVGTGGAMLVGGTGIAEVILPVQTRLDSTRGQTVGRGRAPLLGSSAAPASESEQSSSNLLPAKFAATTSARSNLSDMPKATIHQATDTAATTPKEDEERTGFAVSRGQITTTKSSSSTLTNTASSKKPHNHNNNSSNSQKPHRSNDDRVFSKFVARERDSRFNK